MGFVSALWEIKDSQITRLQAASFSEAPMVHVFKRKEQKNQPNYTDYKAQQLAQGREQYVTSTPSAKAWQRMQTLFNLVNYAEKWVQVSPWIPLGSCSLRGSTWWCLWCLFLSWAGKGDNPPRRLNGKYHVRSQCCSQLYGEELSQCFLSCFFLALVGGCYRGFEARHPTSC